VETDGAITILYEMQDGAPAYDERSADRVQIWHEETVVATLTWHEGDGSTSNHARYVMTRRCDWTSTPGSNTTSSTAR
jgi:hypothetical protein